MNRDVVIAEMQRLGLASGTYIAFGSTPLAVLGIRDVNDIDLLVSVDAYNRLEREGWRKIHKGENDQPVVNGLFEAHQTWAFSPYAPTLEELLSRSMQIEGIAFASLEDVRRWKADSGRPKDLTDLRLIANFTSQSQRNS